MADNDISFDIIIRATSVIVTNGKLAEKYLTPVLNIMTYEDEFEEVTHVLGYMYDEQTDQIFLHKGVDINFLTRLLPKVNIIHNDFDPFTDIKFEYEEIYPPRNDDQQDVINFIAGKNEHVDNLKSRQLFLVKSTGFGKTFCAGTGLCLFGAKTLIIMHRDNLRHQWIDSLHKMIGMSSKDYHEIASSEELYNIAYGIDVPDYDVYLMTHATFRAGLKKIGNIADAMNIGKNLKIGLKIIDEAHLEFRNTIMLDYIFNVYRNLYLTATKGRSSKEENSIFTHVFCNCVNYEKRLNRASNDSRPDKWVEYYAISVNTHVNPYIEKFRIAGGRGMSPASYGKWCIQYDKKHTHIKCCIEILRMIYNNDDQAKVLVFMPLIELCEEAAYQFRKTLNNDPGFDYDLNIKTINSHNTKHENENNKKADVIVTTIGSCGTGVDIPGMTDIICCSPFASKITMQQVIGRLRYCGKTSHYYDIYDSSVNTDKVFWRIRQKAIKNQVLKIEQLAWSETPKEEEKNNGG